MNEECLAYQVRSELGEIDYGDNHEDLDKRLVDVLGEAEDILQVRTDFEL